MTHEELVAALVARGYHGERRKDGSTLLWKRVRWEGEGHVCLTNRKISIHATVHEIQSPNHTHRSVVFDLTAEGPFGWTKLEVYGVEWKDAVEQAAGIERRLLAAWDAMHGETR